jgi:predicted AAA+ superfamily ATPase
MIQRPIYLSQLKQAVRRSPVTALLGPRQCGKTTLAHLFGKNRTATYFDLESQPDVKRLQNPEMVLDALKGLVVLDEIQAMPSLFKTLRVMADRAGDACRYLILGSAAPDIIKHVSESLAGRVEFVDLSGFDLSEVGDSEIDQLWVRGGFPKSFLADSKGDSMAWREGFIRTFLERDIPQLGIGVPAAAMRRFWTMLAHYHGQTWNSSEIARSMGLSDKTTRSYLDILTGTYMVRQLQPWFENIGKRQVKAPKIFLRDSGILHTLLDLPDHHTLSGHPKLGASWEGFAIEQILQILKPRDAYFWATHSGAELDLFIPHRNKRYGFEIKYNEAPNTRKSMHVAIDDLKLDHLWIIYPGKETYPVGKKISVLPLKNLSSINLKNRIDNPIFQ